MKKLVITILAIIMMMTLASCGNGEITGRTRTYTIGSNVISVHEYVMKDGEKVDTNHYEVVYDSPEAAEEAFNNWNK